MFEKHIEQVGLDSLRNTNNRYYIDLDGVIKGVDGFDLPQSLDVNGFPQVFANLWDGAKFYRVVDLMAIHFKNIAIPQSLWCNVEGFYIDQDHGNQHASNVGYRFRNAPLACVDHPNFYYVPMFTKYGISFTGDLIHIGSGKVKSNWYRTKPNSVKKITGGYKCQGASGDVGGYVTISRHRFLCLVFKPYPNNVDRMDVNHLDGVPGNDDLDNLEWASRSRNNIHAYRNNLRTQNKPLLARNLRTGRVSEFTSVNEAAEATEVSAGVITLRLTKACMGLSHNGYQFKYVDDTHDWVDYEDIGEAISRYVQNKAIWVRNCRNGEVIRYESISEAGRVLGDIGPTIAARLLYGLDEPHRGYQFKYVTDDTDWAEFNPDRLDCTGSIPRKVVGRNLVTGETCEYPSIKECVRKQDTSTHLADMLRQGQQPTCPNGWQYKYEGEPWLESNGVGNKRRDVTARHVLSGVMVYARSLRELGVLLDLNHQTLGKAAESEGTLVVGSFQCMWGIGKTWPDISATDLQALRSGESFRGDYHILTDTETNQQHYFASVDACLEFLTTVKSKPVFYRLVRAGVLLDVKYSYSKYMLKCHLKR